jgi:CRP-like cAMP-binding protein
MTCDIPGRQSQRGSSQDGKRRVERLPENRSRITRCHRYNGPTRSTQAALANEIIHDLQRIVAISERKDALDLPGWSSREWDALNSFAVERTLSAGEVLIKRGETERAVYFVTEGELEVVTLYEDGQSLGPLYRVKAGSVVGEQSFFDELPRSAKVWALRPSRLRRLGFEEFQAYSRAHPDRALELLFALGKVLSIRLRYATACTGR